jgi:autotransporter-associated beta strand protein
MFRIWTGSFAQRKRRLIHRHPSVRLPKPRGPLRLEPLEDRLAPAVHTWTGAVDGSWANDANWLGGSPAGDMSADLVFSSNAMNFINTNDITTPFGVQSITFSGDTSYTIGGNPLSLNSGGVLLDSTVTSAADTLNLDITLGVAQTWSVTGPNATLVMNGMLSGGTGAGLTKAANGTLSLAGGNALLQGGVTLNAGVLLVGNAMALGTAPITLTGGALQASAVLSIDNPLNVNGPAAIGGMSQLTFTGAGMLSPGNTLTVDNAAMTTFSGVLSGAGGLTDAGSGTIVLGAPNAYTGPTSINAGTLQLGVTGGVPSNSALTVAPGATFDLNTFSDAVASLAGAGDVTLGSGSLSVGGDNTNTTFAGILSGAGSLTKIGTGTLTLTGNNTYTGSTLAVAGTLLVNGSQPGSDVNVGIDATLGGSGTVGAITTAGSVSPGGPGGPGTGILASGNVVFSAESMFTVTLNGTTAGAGYDQLNVTGTADLTANPNLNVSTLFPGMGADLFTILTTTGGLSGTFAGLSDNSTISANGQMFRINYTANAVTLTKVVSPTSVVVTSAVSPSVYGQPISFTAMVSPMAPATGTPTGSVTFMDGTTPLGMSTVVNGVAVFTTTATLSVGEHSITAVYNGDATFGSSTSSLFTQTVNQASTVTTLTGSPNPSSEGLLVTFTATVIAGPPGTGIPTGMVTFNEGTTMLGTGTLDSNGRATFSTSSLALGTHMISAVYSGDANFTASTSQPFSQNVLPPTLTTLTSSPNPSVFGQAVSFTATVAPATPGTGTPTGMITFMSGSMALGTGTLSGGVATFSTSVLTASSNPIMANYAGDTMFGPSTSAVLSQMVIQASTNLTLSSSSNPSGTEQPVTFTATALAVSPGAGIPTGTVTFMEGTTTLGTGTLDASGHATFQTSSLAEGTHSITASYSGDTNFLSSTSSPLTQAVQPGTTTVLVSSPNPSVFGQAVTFSATVTASAGTSTPTGSVIFMDGTTVLGSGMLSTSGVATFSSTTFSPGSHSVTAHYSGDSMFAPSTSSVLNQIINMASTSITLTSSSSSSTSGQAVTFTAVVTPTGPGAGTPTGSVTFMDGTAVLGSSSLSGETATFQTSSLSTGSHQITAVYSGDANFAASTSSTLTQTVGSMNQLFVTQVYQDLLGRAPDSGGLDHFSSILDMNQATRNQVAQTILSSQEGRTHEVEMLYQEFLSRQADPVGLDLSTRFLGMGGSYFQLVSVITGSHEYFQRAGSTNSGFLTTIYQDALSRGIDSVGQSLGSQALNNGASLMDVAKEVFTSQEGLQDLVQSYYNRFLHRAADPAGLNAATTALQQRVQQEMQQMSLTAQQQQEQQQNGLPAPVGASVDQLVGVIVGSDEYFGRV